jgi:iron complex transport system ATP-binding protein
MKLDIKDISLSIEDKRILKGISLSVGEGEFLALMGPNGSGKTTLLRCIMNYLRPEKGAVLIDAKPIHTMSDRELARTFAVVPQNSQIDFSFTAHEMVMMGRTPHAKARFIGGSKDDEVATRKAMEKTDTWKFADRDFLSLSGGERQRVIIARALAQEPKILLLDEPTVYLDITGQLSIMDLLRTLNHEGLTIIAVMHDINLASRYCNRVALLHEGRLASYGTPEEVFTPENIAGIYDVEVIVRRDPLTNSVSVIPKMASSMSAIHGTRVHVLCGGGSGGHIASDLVDAGYSPSAGVINVLDSDFELAKDLHIPVVTEIPFAQISNEAYDKNLEMVREVQAVVVTDFPVGPGNLRNLEAASVALGSGKKVFILGSDTISERDFVGGKAKLLVDDLIRKGAVTVKDKRELVGLLGEKLGR